MRGVYKKQEKHRFTLKRLHRDYPTSSVCNPETTSVRFPNSTQVPVHDSMIPELVFLSSIITKTSELMDIRETWSFPKMSMILKYPPVALLFSKYGHYLKMLKSLV